MKWEWLQPSKVCWCIPLRRGIIAFVYLNLVISLACLIGFLVMDYVKVVIRLFYTASLQQQLIRLGRTKTSIATLLLCLVGGVIAELGMTIFALVALHTKTMKLIRNYLYYSVGFTSLIGVLRVVNLYDSDLFEWSRYEFLVLPIFLGFKIYYILLLRSKVMKMEMAQNVTIKYVKDICIEDERRPNKETAEGKVTVLDTCVQLIPEENEREAEIYLP